ncbi:phosphatase PAP2 family protein [Streptomyces sp. NPDC048248]|uniref:phosphatase PAP2 family protein n=1 Tax=Streptomyces sp. NPDC048248 TaxID=3365523 RepID=UPI0037166B79
MITWQVAGHGPLRALDERIGRGVAASRVPAPLAEFLADLGNTTVALPVLLVVVVGTLWASRRRQVEREDAPGGTASGRGGPVERWWLPPLGALVVLAAVPALVVPFKLWLARPGPSQMAGGAHDGFYPSGHGATAAVAYGVAALLLTRCHRQAGRGAGAGWALGAGVVLLNAGVGTGLVRQGYHWPLDVLGSWCLAGVLLAAWCVVCGRWSGGRPG